eukprot:432349_1
MGDVSSTEEVMEWTDCSRIYFLGLILQRLTPLIETFHTSEVQELMSSFQQIFKWKGPTLTTDRKVFGTKIMTLYHVTDEKCAESIFTENMMKCGSKGMFGGGIYFAESAYDAHHKAKRSGVLITAKVFVGNEYTVKNQFDGFFDFPTLQQLGFDSVYAPNGAGSGAVERVVYSSDQVQLLTKQKYEPKPRLSPSPHGCVFSEFNEEEDTTETTDSVELGDNVINNSNMQQSVDSHLDKGSGFVWSKCFASDMEDMFFDLQQSLVKSLSHESQSLAKMIVGLVLGDENYFGSLLYDENYIVEEQKCEKMQKALENSSVMSVQDENTSPIVDPLNTQYVHDYERANNCMLEPLQISPIIHAKKEESLIKNRNGLCDAKLITNNKYVRITLENTDTTTFYHQCRAITIDNAEYDPLLICQQTQITQNSQYIAEYSMGVSNTNSTLHLIESSRICTFAQETARVTCKLPARTQLKKNMLASRMINLITKLPLTLKNPSISPVAVPSKTNQTNNSCKNNRNSKQQNRESGNNNQQRSTNNQNNCNGNNGGCSGNSGNRDNRRDDEGNDGNRKNADDDDASKKNTKKNNEDEDENDEDEKDEKNEEDEEEIDIDTHDRDKPNCHTAQKLNPNAVAFTPNKCNSTFIPTLPVIEENDNNTKTLMSLQTGTVSIAENNVYNSKAKIKIKKKPNIGKTSVTSNMSKYKYNPSQSQSTRFDMRKSFLESVIQDANIEKSLINSSASNATDKFKKLNSYLKKSMTIRQSFIINEKHTKIIDYGFYEQKSEQLIYVIIEKENNTPQKCSRKWKLIQKSDGSHLFNAQEIWKQYRIPGNKLPTTPRNLQQNVINDKLQIVTEKIVNKEYLIKIISKIPWQKQNCVPLFKNDKIQKKK